MAGGDGFAAVVEDDGALECAESAFVKSFGDIPIGANPAAPRCGVAFSPDDSSFVEGGVEGLGSGFVAVAGGEGCLGALDLLFPFKELGLDVGGALGSSLGGRGEEKDDFHDEGCREGDAEMASGGWGKWRVRKALEDLVFMTRTSGGEGSCRRRANLFQVLVYCGRGRPRSQGGCPRSEEFAGLGRRMGADSRGHEQRVRRAEEGMGHLHRALRRRRLRHRRVRRRWDLDLRRLRQVRRHRRRHRR